MRYLAVILVPLSVLFGFSPASASEAGKRVFTDYECISCHMVSAYGISVVKSENQEEEEDDWDDDEETIVPPDLSDIGNRREPAFLVKYLRKKVAVQGRKHKKRFKGSKEELKELVLWLVSLKKKPTAKLK
jgi:hypothetical protein